MRSITGYTRGLLFAARRAAARLGDHADGPWPLIISLRSKDERLVILGQDRSLLQPLDSKLSLEGANHFARVTERYMEGAEEERTETG